MPCRAEAATASNGIELVYYKLLHLSSHYNTQVGHVSTTD